jgi:hypothetical protein
VIARLYASPWLAHQDSGETMCFTSRLETAAYFDDVLHRYRERGCTSCGYLDLAVVPLGSGCALASLTWELRSADGAVLSTWRESYLLERIRSGPRVFASIDHVN